jgi:uncharacterized protein (DUF305 family)
MKHVTLPRTLIAAAFAAGTLLGAATTAPASAQHAGHATPPPETSSPASCETFVPATPMAMTESSPEAAREQEQEQAEFDLTYIDMMIPHHGSIIALAEAAQPKLTDQRLIDMTAAIIDTQQAEIAELETLRGELYPDAPVTDINNHDLLHASFPSLLTWSVPMEEWGNIMSPSWQVGTFCSAPDPDLAFVQQTIPHHEMAVLSSQDALTLSTHPEVKAIAERVIPAQTAEIEILKQIELELTGAS